MKVKYAVALVCTTLILAVIGLGFSIIYSDYLFSPAQGLASFQVRDRSLMYMHPEELPQAESSATGYETMSDYIQDWAKANKAAVFRKDSFATGCAYADFSGWLKGALGIADIPGDHDIFVSDETSFLDVYTKGDVLFPDKADLKIKEIYEDDSVPELLNGVGFLYPLPLSTTAEGMYFTDATQVNDLVSLFESNGYEVMSLRDPQGTTLVGLVQTLLNDSFLSRAVTLTLCGLLFCFVYMLLMLYREIEREIWIHHIFGLSYQRILLGTICMSVGVALTAGLLYGTVLSTGLTYIGKAALTTLFLSVTFAFVVLSALIGTVGYMKLLGKLKERGA